MTKLLFKDKAEHSVDGDFAFDRQSERVDVKIRGEWSETPFETLRLGFEGHYRLYYEVKRRGLTDAADEIAKVIPGHGPLERSQFQSSLSEVVAIACVAIAEHSARRR